jgi:hypothetical protein
VLDHVLPESSRSSDDADLHDVIPLIRHFPFGFLSIPQTCLSSDDTITNRKRFKVEVETRQIELEALAGSRKEIQAARRKAVIEVLMRYNLLNWRGDVSTNYLCKVRTNKLGATWMAIIPYLGWVKNKTT